MSLNFGNSSGSFFGGLSQKTFLTIGVSLVVLVIVGIVAYALASNSHPDGSLVNRQAESARAMQALSVAVAHQKAAKAVTASVSEANRDASFRAASHKTTSR